MVSIFSRILVLWNIIHTLKNTIVSKLKNKQPWSLILKVLIWKMRLWRAVTSTVLVVIRLDCLISSKRVNPRITWSWQYGLWTLGHAIKLFLWNASQSGILVHFPRIFVSCDIRFEFQFWCLFLFERHLHFFSDTEFKFTYLGISSHVFITRGRLKIHEAEKWSFPCVVSPAAKCSATNGKPTSISSPTTTRRETRWTRWSSNAIAVVGCCWDTWTSLRSCWTSCRWKSNPSRRQEVARDGTGWWDWFFCTFGIGIFQLDRGIYVKKSWGSFVGEMKNVLKNVTAFDLKDTRVSSTVNCDGFCVVFFCFSQWKIEEIPDMERSFVGKMSLDHR